MTSKADGKFEVRNQSRVDGVGIFAIRGELDGESEDVFADSEQFIGLRIDGDELLLSVRKIVEIIMFSKLTFVPGAPQHIAGVINLRGQILPAILMRSLFEQQVAPITTNHRIVVVQEGNAQVGLIVDGITNVIHINKNAIEPNLMSASDGKNYFISDIAKVGKSIKGIVDIQKIVTSVVGEPSTTDALDQEVG